MEIQTLAQVKVCQECGNFPPVIMLDIAKTKIYLCDNCRTLLKTSL